MGGRGRDDRGGDRNDRSPAEADRASPVFSPSAELPPLDPDEEEALRRIGQRWRSEAPGRSPHLRKLPLDPALGRYHPPPAPRRLGRLTRVEMFQPDEPGELVTTSSAAVPASRTGRALARARRILLGPPLSSAALLQERMRKLVALPVLSSDLLSSVAYGPEAMVAVLALAGAAALNLTLPIAAGLVVLMIAVGLSYRQTIRAYPHGAGSYLVASYNLGARPGLAAAAGLMLDYILTVAVSVSAGVHAVTSALPGLAPLAVPLGLLVIAVLLAGNLRGVRAAGNLFALPTYAFLVAVALLILVGMVRAATRGFAPVPPPPVPVVEGLSLLLVLRAFSSGATSMTGIEAVSNATPSFRPVEWRNARTTLTWMLSLLVVLFVGLIVLIHLNGLVPRADETILSQLAHRTFPTGPWYALIQAATATILLLAANTAFNGFPRLLFFMARGGHAPRLFLHLGDRLGFSNGIVFLAGTAALILVAFRGETALLIPLYAVGVFLAFTLSQLGMVVHWRRARGAHWRKRLAVNAVGAVLSALVLATSAVTKFAGGAWVVVVAVPLIVLVSLRIHRHYARMDRALRLAPPPATPRFGWEAEERPQEVRHLVVVPVDRFNLAVLRVLAYAASLGPPVLAVHISPEEEEADRFREQWEAWGDHVRLEVLVSPYRAVIPPLAHYLQALHTLRPDLALTVIVPELVLRRRWHRLLHHRTAPRLRRALREVPGIVITSVPLHVPC
ncbi:APC family permease [Micromonospora sp. NPDC049559]|uniref:APC family permease n=1 Tax=Micromonospora sp. NPDC049559 TaxID=3155923 RepID=UPI003449C81B